MTAQFSFADQMIFTGKRQCNGKTKGTHKTLKNYARQSDLNAAVSTNSQMEFGFAIVIRITRFYFNSTSFIEISLCVYMETRRLSFGRESGVERTTTTDKK